VRRTKVILLLKALVSPSQAITAAWLRWLTTHLHAPNSLLRPLLVAGMTAGLLKLLLRRGETLCRGEVLALLRGTAGGLAHLIDTPHLGGVAELIPVVLNALASPRDFLIIDGFLGFLPLSLRRAHEGGGLYALHRQWYNQVHPHWTECLLP
jgi:hypothetical protein